LRLHAQRAAGERRALAHRHEAITTLFCIARRTVLS
jgi:hypothetical protein